MSGGINSDTEEAQNHATEISQGEELESLTEVADDNTPANDNIFSSYAKFSEVFTQLRDRLKADGSNIESAAFIYEAIDSETAKNFINEQG